MIQNSNPNPIVSVVMVTYNHENYIRKAVEGVLMQQCNFTIELILANDASPDGSNAIIQDILKNNPNAHRINYLNRDKNIGGQANFEEAYKQCKGTYIAHCEGDDYWTDPLKLQKQIDFLEANKDYVLCFHKVKILKPNGALTDDFITKVPQDYETIEALARLGNYIHTPSVVYRNIVKELPYELVLSPIGDYFLYLVLAQHGKLKHIDEEMAVYRYGVGVHSTQDEIKMAKSNFKLFTLLLSYFNNPVINKILLERQLGALDNFEKLIQGQYAEAFVSNTVFFKAIASLKQPKSFWKKLKFKIFRK